MASGMSTRPGGGFRFPKTLLMLKLLVAAVAVIPSVEAALPPKWVSRAEWGANGTYPPMPPAHATDGVKIHYTGVKEEERDHEGCKSRVREIQYEHQHDPVQQWEDIAYNLVVCQHGYVIEGRGIDWESGANGKGLNRNHDAILGLVGNKGVTDPSPEMIQAFKDAITYYREDKKYPCGKQILGHRDGRETECPGEVLYGMVHDGTLEPDAKADDPET